MMNIKIKTTGISLTDNIQDYLTKKITQIEQSIGGNKDTMLCEVELAKTTGHHKQGDIYKAELNVQMEGKHFYARSEQENLFAAIDIVKDEMIQELKRSRSKEITLVRKGGLKIKQILKGLKW